MAMARFPGRNSVETVGLGWLFHEWAMHIPGRLNASKAAMHTPRDMAEYNLDLDQT